jgi:hypothetical protein
MLILLALMTSALPAATAPSRNLEERLEKAVHDELVLGDLRGAMEQYKAIVGHSGKARVSAARALFRMGQCLEKLGRRSEARALYTRIVKEYSDAPETVAEAEARLADWGGSIPGPLNLDFDEGVVNKLPAAWFVPSDPNQADHWAQLRTAGCMSGTCAVVLVPDDAPAHVGNLMQSFRASAYRGKTVRLRAWIRLEAVAPEDRAQMWLSVDRGRPKSLFDGIDIRQGFFDNMADRPIRSAQWTECEIVAPVAEDAAYIKFGIMSVGRGRVWVDNVSFKTTGSLP